MAMMSLAMAYVWAGVSFSKPAMGTPWSLLTSSTWGAPTRRKDQIANLIGNVEHLLKYFGQVERAWRCSFRRGRFLHLSHV